jgi:hypothetical protein
MTVAKVRRPPQPISALSEAPDRVYRKVHLDWLKVEKKLPAFSSTSGSGLFPQPESEMYLIEQKKAGSYDATHPGQLGASLRHAMAR